MEELKPCPFCGKDVAVLADAQELEVCDNFEDEDCPCLESKQVNYGKYAEHCPYVAIVCDMHKGGCGTSTGFHKSLQPAIEAWNRRTT